jgi:hypothetical protein
MLKMALLRVGLGAVLLALKRQFIFGWIESRIELL